MPCAGHAKRRGFQRHDRRARVQHELDTDDASGQSACRAGAGDRDHDTTTGSGFFISGRGRREHYRRAAPCGVRGAAVAAAVSTANPSIVRSVTGANPQQLIGGGSVTPNQPPPGPSTVQVGLNAFIPREALVGTGITSIELGTSFPVQSLGAGGTFEAATAGTVLNLMDSHRASPSFAPVKVTPCARHRRGHVHGGAFLRPVADGYDADSVRGSDGSSATSQPTLPGPADRTTPLSSDERRYRRRVGRALSEARAHAARAAAVGAEGVCKGRHTACA